jgi:hypothetical protein
MSATFAELAEGVNTGSSFYAKGLLAPLLRSMNHILFALAGSSCDPTLLTEDEIRNELHEAQAHLNPAYFYYPTTLGEIALLRLTRYQALLTAAADEFDTDGKAERLRTLTNAAADLICYLDWDLAGIDRNYSDPGTSL